MDFDSFIEIVKNISSIVTLLLGLAAIFGSTVPSLRKGIVKTLRPYDEEIEALKESNKSLLRNAITRIYYANLETKTLTPWERENMLYLYDSYKVLVGNTYVHEMVDDMKNWDIKTE